MTSRHYSHIQKTTQNSTGKWSYEYRRNCAR